MSQRDQSISFLLISKMNKADQRKKKQRKRTGLLYFHGKTSLKAIDISQRDLWMSLLLISKINKTIQEKEN